MQKEKQLNAGIKLALAALLLLCLLPMPYGYYILVRYAAMLGFGWLAYQSRDTNVLAVVVYAGLALLFQPFIKAALGRTVWNFVDVIVAAGLLASLFMRPTEAAKDGRE